MYIRLHCRCKQSEQNAQNSILFYARISRIVRADNRIPEVDAGVMLMHVVWIVYVWYAQGTTNTRDIIIDAVICLQFNTAVWNSDEKMTFFFCNSTRTVRAVTTKQWGIILWSRYTHNGRKKEKEKKVMQYRRMIILSLYLNITSYALCLYFRDRQTERAREKEIVEGLLLSKTLIIYIVFIFLFASRVISDSIYYNVVIWSWIFFYRL